MIHKMPKLPHDISIDQPVPGKARLKERKRRKKTHAKSKRRDGKITTRKPVENIDQERDLVLRTSKLAHDDRADDFDHKQERDQRIDDMLDPVQRTQTAVVPGPHQVDYRLKIEKDQDLLIKSS